MYAYAFPGFLKGEKILLNPFPVTMSAFKLMSGSR
jgi:hypothetical protein